MTTEMTIVETLRWIGAPGAAAIVTAFICLKYNGKKKDNPEQERRVGCPLHKDLAEDVKEIKENVGEANVGIGKLDGKVEVLIAKVCSK